MPNGQLTSADITPSEAIMNAVFDIAHNKSGISFQGFKLWRMPKAGDIAEPYLVVEAPELAFYLDAHGNPAGKIMKRGMGVINKAVATNVYCILPWDPEDDNTFRMRTLACDQLEQAFAVHYTLDALNTTGTYKAEIMEPVAGKLLVGKTEKSLEGAVLFSCAQITVLAYMQLATVL